MKRLLVILALAVLLVGGGFYWQLQAAGRQSFTFRTVEVERGDLSAAVSATGVLQPEEVVDVGAQVVGMIREFGRDPHDENKVVDYRTAVEAGTVLAQIDDSLYQARLARAEAQVAQAESAIEQSHADLKRAEADLLQFNAKRDQANRDWVRAQRLRQKEVLTEEEFDAYRANFEVTAANVISGEAAIVQAKSGVTRADKTLIAAKADLSEAARNLDYTTIRSPVKGVIIDRRVNVGQTVVASLNAPSLFLIAKDLRRMQIWASVNEADIGQIRARTAEQPGQPVFFTVDAYPGEEFKGEVLQVRLNATMTQNVVTYTVVVEVDNVDLRLFPYLTANVRFEIEHRSGVLLVPNSALRWKPRPEQIVPEARDQFAAASAPRDRAPRPKKETGVSADRATLWVEENGSVRPLAVRIGRTDGTNTEVTGDGLEVGTPIVVGEIEPTEDQASSNPFAPKMFGSKKG